MSAHVSISRFTESDRDRWDGFVLDDSINGTFLQTRRFISYHPEGAFEDHSLILQNGNTIVAVVLGHTITGTDGISYISHGGTTAGGIVLSRKALSISYLDAIFASLEDYYREHRFSRVMLKQTCGEIFSRSSTELLDYYYYLNGYTQYTELGYYIDYENYGGDTISNFSSSRRRDYRYSERNNLEFAELVNESRIREFHTVLCDNYRKFGREPFHTPENFLDFRFDRLKDETRFYGVYRGGELIAGGMVFLFDHRTFHTQYLAVRQDQTGIFCNEYLYKNLIDEARRLGYRYISFGTSTFDRGRVLNRPLAIYKEGYGMDCYLNKSFGKDIAVRQ